MTDSPNSPKHTAPRLSALVLLLPALAAGQVPVDDDGNVIGQYEAATGHGEAVTASGLSSPELEELVGPVALYPDDLLAVVLPAAAYPLQIAAAARFLDDLEEDPSLKPDPEWDDSVVALTNYPEVVKLMNDDLDWTYRLGEAVIAEQPAVVAAVESFRDRAYAAGNLKSDEYQTVSQDDGVIEIEPVSEDVIYVPYYEPRRVVVYQPRPVYHYHPHAYPVYYYPYSARHRFHHNYFWGVTTAFSIGWYTDSLHVYHHSYHGHPYYGRHYRNNWWYRRPSINVYNTTYVNNRRYVNNRDGYRDRQRHGDRWRPRDNRRQFSRQVRNRDASGRSVRTTQRRDAIRFRERDNRTTTLARSQQRRDARVGTDNRQRDRITFRDRGEQGRSTTTRTRDRSENRTRREQRDTVAQQQRRQSVRTPPTAANTTTRSNRGASQHEQRRMPRQRTTTTRQHDDASRSAQRRQPTPAQRSQRQQPSRTQRSQRQQPTHAQSRRQEQPARANSNQRSRSSNEGSRRERGDSGRKSRSRPR